MILWLHYEEGSTWQKNKKQNKTCICTHSNYGSDIHIQQGVLFLKPWKIASGVAADFKAEDISPGIEPCDSVCLPLHVRRGGHTRKCVYLSALKLASNVKSEL